MAFKTNFHFYLKTSCVFVLSLGSFAYGSTSLDTTTTIRNNTTAGTDDIDDQNAMTAKYHQSEKEKVALQKQLESLMENAQQHGLKQVSVGPETTVNETKNLPTPINESVSAETSVSTIQKSIQNHKKQTKRPLDVMVFESSQKRDPITNQQEKYTVIPALSWVKVKVIGGVEAVSDPQQPFPVLLQADYAFQGPNGFRIDMRKCLFEAKTNALLNVERVIGQVSVMSCVRNSGEFINRSVRGYLRGSDSNFGIIGDLISRQGAVLAAAAISSLAKGAAEAVANAQTTTSVVAGSTGSAVSATNVTGDQAKYILGTAVLEPATIVTQWYLDYAKQLVPAIAVGTGTDAFVVLQDAVEIPLLNDSEDSVYEDN